jgi:hypothetical protein
VIPVLSVLAKLTAPVYGGVAAGPAPSAGAGRGVVGCAARGRSVSDGLDRLASARGDVAKRRFGIRGPDRPDQDLTDEAEGMLFQLVEQGDRIGYLYVFGDIWVHH